MQAPGHPEKSRLLEVDFIRAFAVVLMVFTHVSMFFYNYNNQLATGLADWGGYLCFSLFLFVSGVTLPVIMQNHSVSYAKTKLLRRALIFAGLYIFFGLLYGGADILFGLILLQDMPVFADFIFGLAIFFGIGTLLTPFVSKQNILLLMSMSVVLLLVGFNLYFSEYEGPLSAFKSILVGDGDLHRFPVFQYLMIYASGIVYGLYRNNLNFLQNISVFITLLITTIIAYSQWGFDRWQATPAFIFTGITASFGLILIWNLINSVEFKNRLRLTNYMVRLSKAAAGILIVHLVIIFVFAQLFQVSFNFAVAGLLSLLVLLISMLIGEKIKL